MASLITHPIVPFSIGVALGRSTIPLRLLFIGMMFSMLPDADVVAFRFGIPYEHMLGHRGISHSLAFAAAFAAAAALIPAFREIRGRVFWFLFFAMASHGVLDAMTSGGRGVGFFIPFTAERFFFPLHPVRVSPLNVKSFFTERGVAILYSEFLWIWLPCAVAALAILTFRKLRARA